MLVAFSFFMLDFHQFFQSKNQVSRGIAFVACSQEDPIVQDLSEDLKKLKTNVAELNFKDFLDLKVRNWQTTEAPWKSLAQTPQDLTTLNEYLKKVKNFLNSNRSMLLNSSFRLTLLEESHHDQCPIANKAQDDLVALSSKYVLMQYFEIQLTTAIYFYQRDQNSFDKDHPITFDYKNYNLYLSKLMALKVNRNLNMLLKHFPLGDEASVEKIETMKQYVAKFGEELPYVLNNQVVELMVPTDTALLFVTSVLAKANLTDQKEVVIDFLRMMATRDGLSSMYHFNELSQWLGKNSLPNLFDPAEVAHNSNDLVKNFFLPNDPQAKIKSYNDFYYLQENRALSEYFDVLNDHSLIINETEQSIEIDWTKSPFWNAVLNDAKFHHQLIFDAVLNKDISSLNCKPPQFGSTDKEVEKNFMQNCLVGPYTILYKMIGANADGKPWSKDSTINALAASSTRELPISQILHNLWYVTNTDDFLLKNHLAENIAAEFPEFSNLIQHSLDDLLGVKGANAWLTDAILPGDLIASKGLTDEIVARRILDDIIHAKRHVFATTAYNFAGVGNFNENSVSANGVALTIDEKKQLRKQIYCRASQYLKGVSKNNPFEFTNHDPTRMENFCTNNGLVFDGKIKQDLYQENYQAKLQLLKSKVQETLTGPQSRIAQGKKQLDLEVKKITDAFELSDAWTGLAGMRFFASDGILSSVYESAKQWIGMDSDYKNKFKKLVTDFDFRPHDFSTLSLYLSKQLERFLQNNQFLPWKHRYFHVENIMQQLVTSYQQELMKGDQSSIYKSLDYDLSNYGSFKADTLITTGMENIVPTDVRKKVLLKNFILFLLKKSALDDANNISLKELVNISPGTLDNPKYFYRNLIELLQSFKEEFNDQYNNFSNRSINTVTGLFVNKDPCQSMNNRMDVVNSLSFFSISNNNNQSSLQAIAQQAHDFQQLVNSGQRSGIASSALNESMIYAQCFLDYDQGIPRDKNNQEVRIPYTYLSNTNLPNNKIWPFENDLVLQQYFKNMFKDKKIKSHHLEVPHFATLALILMKVLPIKDSFFEASSQSTLFENNPVQLVLDFFNFDQNAPEKKIWRLNFNDIQKNLSELYVKTYSHAAISKVSSIIPYLSANHYAQVQHPRDYFGAWSSLYHDQENQLAGLSNEFLPKNDEASYQKMINFSNSEKSLELTNKKRDQKEKFIQDKVFSNETSILARFFKTKTEQAFDFEKYFKTFESSVDNVEIYNDLKKLYSNVLENKYYADLDEDLIHTILNNGSDDFKQVKFNEKSFTAIQSWYQEIKDKILTPDFGIMPLDRFLEWYHHVNSEYFAYIMGGLLVVSGVGSVFLAFAPLAIAVDSIFLIGAIGTSTLGLFYQDLYNSPMLINKTGRMVSDYSFYDDNKNSKFGKISFADLQEKISDAQKDNSEQKLFEAQLLGLTVPASSYAGISKSNLRDTQESNNQLIPRKIFIFAFNNVIFNIPWAKGIYIRALEVRAKITSTLVNKAGVALNESMKSAVEMAGMPFFNLPKIMFLKQLKKISNNALEFFTIRPNFRFFNSFKNTSETLEHLMKSFSQSALKIKNWTNAELTEMNGRLQSQMMNRSRNWLLSFVGISRANFKNALRQNGSKIIQFYQTTLTLLNYLPSELLNGTATFSGTRAKYILANLQSEFSHLAIKDIDHLTLHDLSAPTLFGSLMEMQNIASYLERVLTVGKGRENADALIVYFKALLASNNRGAQLIEEELLNLADLLKILKQVKTNYPAFLEQIKHIYPKFESAQVSEEEVFQMWLQGTTELKTKGFSITAFLDESEFHDFTQALLQKSAIEGAKNNLQLEANQLVSKVSSKVRDHFQYLQAWSTYSLDAYVEAEILVKSILASLPYKDIAIISEKGAQNSSHYFLKIETTSEPALNLNTIKDQLSPLGFAVAKIEKNVIHIDLGEAGSSGFMGETSKLNENAMEELVAFVWTKRVGQKMRIPSGEANSIFHDPFAPYVETLALGGNLQQTVTMGLKKIIANSGKKYTKAEVAEAKMQLDMLERLNFEADNMPNSANKTFSGLVAQFYPQHQDLIKKYYQKMLNLQMPYTGETIPIVERNVLCLGGPVVRRDLLPQTFLTYPEKGSGANPIISTDATDACLKPE